MFHEASQKIKVTRFLWTMVYFLNQSWNTENMSCPIYSHHTKTWQWSAAGI